MYMYLNTVYDHFGPTLESKLLFGGHEKKLGKGFPGLHVQKQIRRLLKNGQILAISAMPLGPLWRRIMKFTIFVPLTLKLHHTVPYLKRIGRVQCSFEDELENFQLFTHGARCTATDKERRILIAICYLRHSDDLIKIQRSLAGKIGY